MLDDAARANYKANVRLLPLTSEQRAAIGALCLGAHARRLDLLGPATDEGTDTRADNLTFVVAFEELPPVEYSDAYFTLKEGLEQLLTHPVNLAVEQAIRNPHFKLRVQAERQPVYAASGKRAGG